jgi:hypothetical protein
VPSIPHRHPHRLRLLLEPRQCAAQRRWCGNACVSPSRHAHAGRRPPSRHAVTARSS